MLVWLVCTTLLAQTQERWFPHFTRVDDLWDTEISLVNGDSQLRVIQIEAYDDQGVAEGPWSFSLRPLESFSGDLFSLLPELTLQRGSLKILTNITQLGGLLTFTYRPTSGRTSLPLMEDPSLVNLFPLVENSSQYDSGFALLNPHPQDIGCRLSLFTEDGVLIEEQIHNLPSFGKKVAMLSQWFERFPQRTTLVIESQEPLFGFGLTFSQQVEQIIAVPASSLEVFDRDQDTQLMAQAMPIDIHDLQVDLTFDPATEQVSGQALVSFHMKQGQTKPAFHLEGASIQSLWLDGEALVEGQWRRETLASQAQTVWQVDQDVDPWQTHTLEIHYTFPSKTGSALYTDVNDIYGNGNEWFWPTINCPSERLHHRIGIQVTPGYAYHFMGGGHVTEVTPDQRWEMWQDHDIASYTVFFILAPRQDIVFAERVIDGVTVQSMASSRDEDLIEESFSILSTWLPQLRRDIGPFPMPSGLHLFLTPSGGGMEYYGGTFTSLWALQHEVFHMYYACSMIARSYRDSWWDEAITMWYEEGPGWAQPIADSYQGNWVGARSVVRPGFDTNAYYDGADIMAHIAQQMGSREQFIAYLSSLWGDYHFIPLSTWDFVALLKSRAQLDYESWFQQWLFYGTQKSSKSTQPGCPYHGVAMPEFTSFKPFPR
jgi:hypothetical protein